MTDNRTTENLLVFDRFVRSKIQAVDPTADVDGPLDDPKGSVWCWTVRESARTRHWIELSEEAAEDPLDLGQVEQALERSGWPGSPAECAGVRFTVDQFGNVTRRSS